jgi:proteic killer suppression protein
MVLMTYGRLHRVVKQLRKLPFFVLDKLNAWARSVEREGLREVRRIPGYHDEPLKGDRTGQRSIRLTRAYRAIYTESKDGEIEIVIVEEVNKHEY